MLADLQSRGCPAHLTSDGVLLRWLDWVVALLTGPELVDSHGMQAVRLVDSAMRPDPALGGGCSTSFSTSGRVGEAVDRL